MSTFYQPKSFTNALGSPTGYNFQNNGVSKCLFQNCNPSTMGENSVYTSADYPNASPDSYGCWIPTAASQTELNSNYTVVTNASSGYTQYLFFKPSTGSNPAVLCQADNLSTGWSNSSPVVVENKPDQQITTNNIGQGKLQIQDNDGPVIIVGILDIGSTEHRPR